MDRTLGWIYPDVVDRVHQDFFLMTPPDVHLVIATRPWSLKMMHAGGFDRRAFAQYRQVILDAAAELCTYQQGMVDFVIVSGDLIQSAMGPGWDRELASEIAVAAGEPATTAMTAVVDALSALRVHQVAVVTPFRDEQTEYIRTYLLDSGFTVPAIVGVHTVSTNDIRNLPPNSAYDLAVSTMENDYPTRLRLYRLSGMAWGERIHRSA